jgi:hypothetical protein
MTDQEIEAITEAIQAGIEAAIKQVLANPSAWQPRNRVAMGPTVERAVRAGIESAVQECLVNPFPRKGSPRAMLRNARPLIRAAVTRELKALKEVLVG